MSVCCFVVNPTNNREDKFAFPIAVERIYRNCWLKFAEDNNLYWLKLFIYGTEVQKSDLPMIIDELQQFQKFMESTFELEYLNYKKYILERIKLFIEKLNEVKHFSDDVVLFIG